MWRKAWESITGRLGIIGAGERRVDTEEGEGMGLVSSDNSLWIHFIRAHSSASLSFMRVYAQRAQVPGSFILDGGLGYCKFGWSKYAAPSTEARKVAPELVSRLVVGQSGFLGCVEGPKPEPGPILGQSNLIGMGVGPRREL